MFLVNKRFFKPTKDARVVAILENLRINPEISQAELGKRVLITGARVNSFLKEMNERGLISITPIDGKRFRYELTQQGEEARRNLLGRYMAEIVQIYASLKENIANRLTEIKNKGYKKLACFGASSTCEVVLSCLPMVKGIKVVGVVDNDTKKHGERIFEYVISPPAILRYIKIDGILITSFARQIEIKKDILTLTKGKKIEIFTL